MATFTRERAVALAMQRLNVDEVTANLVVRRNIEACQRVVDLHEIAWLEDTSIALSPLWDARTYLALAKAGAPESGAYGCECNGTGLHYGHGHVENGVFRGHVGTCYRCRGKGWQSPADHMRNAYYDNHVRRVAF